MVAKEVDMSGISDLQQKRDESSLVTVLVLLNCMLIALLFTVSYLQR